jgi:hypothetical protein
MTMKGIEYEIGKKKKKKKKMKRRSSNIIIFICNTTRNFNCLLVGAT